MSTTELLPVWYEHAAISGYGDMKSLETKVDDKVRSAREIVASEFSVEKTLLEKIQNAWAAHFLPRNVRVEPYKIHIYGHEGHFKSHRDTPEKDLVGTFLVGLGDTTKGRGNFLIHERRLRADPCNWVAFHPDVPHSIDQLWESHRAVIAFKIFRHEHSDDSPIESFGDRIKDVFSKMKVPCGIFLNHKYCMGTSQLNGFDSLLLSCARSSAKGRVHLLPVLTTFAGEYFYNEDLGQTTFDTSVYPFTESHVDILLGRNTEEAKERIGWLDGMKRIPFYGLDFDASVVTWERRQQEGENYIGNEADSYREDSIYFSYSLLILPENVQETTSKDGEEGKSDGLRTGGVSPHD
jgi:hypothetical protein